MNIIDFEGRVKMFSLSSNGGIVNSEQLSEAFKGTKIFEYLSNKESMMNQFLTSPLVTAFDFAHRENKMEDIIGKKFG